MAEFMFQNVAYRATVYRTGSMVRALAHYTSLRRLKPSSVYTTWNTYITLPLSLFFWLPWLLLLPMLFRLGAKAPFGPSSVKELSLQLKAMENKVHIIVKFLVKPHIQRV